MGPDRVHLVLLFDTRLGEAKIFLLNIGQWPEDVSFDHLHDLVQVGNDECCHIFLVIHHLLQILESIEPVSL